MASIRSRVSGSARAHSAETLLSTENVISTPGERSGLPARCTSLPGLVGREAVVEALELPRVDLDPVLQAEEPLRD